MDRIDPRVADAGFLFLSTCAAAAEYECCWFAWVGALDGPRNRILPVAAAGYEDHYLEHLHFEISDAWLEGIAARNNLARVVGDIEKEPRAGSWRDAALDRGYRSAAAFPVRSGEHVVAVLAVYSIVIDGFGATEVERLAKLADELGVALGVLRADRARPVESGDTKGGAEAPTLLDARGSRCDTRH